jgi:glutamate formiminotransferase
MNNQIVECIPNFSTSDPSNVEILLDTIGSVEDIKILDHTSDIDHNRTVITFIGSPNAVEEAAFKMVEAAAELIDMTTQTGVHPRVGATDVLPLVPIKEISFEECIELANRLAEKISTELYIPIYLYERAATSHERQNLAVVRGKGYEELKTRITEFKPDYGPAKLGKAGATCLGVREFLVAYNINLKTSDIKIAKQIANKIRERDGGLPGVKAIGLYLADLDCAQVSMNLTDYKRTNKKDVYAEVNYLAQELGTEILNDELIGLTPQQVLEEANH